MHFAGSIIVRESAWDALKNDENNTVKSRALIGAPLNDGASALYLFHHRSDLRNSRQDPRL